MRVIFPEQACQFDTSSTVAAWNRAEGSVQEASQTARAVEQVHKDTADLRLTRPTVRIGLEMLYRQLAELKEQVRRTAAPFPALPGRVGRGSRSRSSTSGWQAL
jgi:hypothetical protein